MRLRWSGERVGGTTATPRENREACLAIHDAELVLGAQVTIFGGAGEPLERFDQVLRSAAAGVVKEAKVVMGRGAFVGYRTEELQRG